MKQAGLGLNLTTKRTRKREFLAEMERVVPWGALVRVIEPHYPKARRGRPPIALETHAAHPLPAAVVQPVRPGDGRSAARRAAVPRVRELDYGAAGCPTRPRSCGFATCWSTHSWPRRCCAWSTTCCSAKGLMLQDRHDGGRHDDRRAELDQERRAASATRRCTRPRRATSGVCHEHRRRPVVLY